MKTFCIAVVFVFALSASAFAGAGSDPATIGGGSGHYPTGQEPSSSNHSNMTIYQTLTCQGCHQGNSFTPASPNNCNCSNSGKH